MLARQAALLALAACFATSAPAQVGDPLPKAALEGITNSQATSLDDFKGRLLLIEFFAHW